MKQKASVRELSKEIEALKGKLQALECKNGLLNEELVDLQKKNSEVIAFDVESRLLQTFELFPISGAIIGLDKRIIRCNPSFAKLLNYPDHELEGKTIEEITFPGDREVGIGELKAIFSGEIEQCSIQKRYITKEKEIVWGETTMALVRNGDRKPLYLWAFIQDITQRIQNETIDAESEEKYRTLTEHLPLGIYRTTIDGKILFANQALANMLDFKTSEELYKHNAEDFFVNIIDRKDEIDQWRKNLEQINSRELTLRTIKGRVINVHDTGKIRLTKEKKIGYIEGIFEDITQKKTALEALQSSELKYRSLITNITDLICEIDENGNFLFINDISKTVIGYKNTELIGQNAFELIHEDDRSLIIEKFNNIKINGGHDSGILRYKHKKGHYIYFECRATLITNNDGSVKLVVISQDLTEKINSDRISTENEERYRLLFNNINTGVAIYKPVEIGRDFILVDINKAGERNSKVSKIDVVGKKVTGIFPEIVDNGLFEVFKEVWKTGEPKALPLKKYSDGKLAEWIENYVFRLPNGHIVVLYEDTSERRHAEQLIKENEEQLNVIFNSAPVIMMLVNENTEILRLNNFGLESAGVLEDQVRGLRGGDVLRCVKSFKNTRGCGYSNDCSGCILRKTIEVTFKTKRNFFKIEADAILLEGKMESRHTVLVSTTIVSYEPQMTVLVTIDDITKRKELENELIKAKNKAEENDKLKSAFLANISHEIRTPMNGIMGFSEMLLKPNISDDKRKHFSNIITEGCHQLLGIINDVLDISKIETGQISICIMEININEIILDMLLFFKPTANKNNISLYQKKSLPDDQAKILTDGIKLKQILTNLIGNSIKFTKQGYIEYGYSLKNEMLEFYVKDTGIGIKPELHSIIFERFRQAEASNSRSYGGTGLGLSISKALTELLGGNIWIESEVGVGTTFYFTIPYKVKDVEAGKSYPSSKEETIFIENPILVVEDDEINYLFLEEVLLQMNYSSIHAKNGMEAISLLKVYPEIKLILMDIKMPVMNGNEATIKIKELRPEIPVIAQTAYALSSEIEAFKKSGFDDFITKPINKSKLVEIINNYIK